MLFRKLLFSELFSYETLMTYALLMLERNPFWRNNQFQCTLLPSNEKYMRFWAAVIDLENDHINTQF